MMKKKLTVRVASGTATALLQRCKFLISSGVLALWLGSFPVCVSLFGEAPQWLRRAAASSVPSYDPKVPAVVLFNERKLSVDESGRVMTESRYAVRIRSREGRAVAVAREIYSTDTGKIRDLHAWLIRPSGVVKQYGKEQMTDSALVNNDIYNEVRVRAIVAGDEAETGTVFGYESSSEDHSIFAQAEWCFQGRLPTLVSRFTLALPKGWRAESATLGQSKIDPLVNGATYTWELQNLPYIQDEPASPPLTSLIPRLAVSYFPPTESRASVRTFDSWISVSQWLSELNEPQMKFSEAISAKARELTVNSKTELERIRAIAQYLRTVTYVSIQTGLGRGGGYRPHSAIEVFSKSYGDCKDKANLMRAMLKTVGISAYPVLIFAGDASYVREEWVSPQQFNHCIVAIRVSEETEAATILQHPTLGRLLIFDPTDEHTSVGDLPDHEQGSLALVVAGDQGALLRMPSTASELNQLEHQTEAIISGDGALTTSIQERARGQFASQSRRECAVLSIPEYRRMIERWIARSVPGANVTNMEVGKSSERDQVTLNVEFKTDRYATLMQHLMIFRPVVVSKRGSLSLTEISRKQPVMLPAEAYTEKIQIRIPDNFEVDELPEPTRLDTPFGAYIMRCEMKGEQLVVTRSLITRSAAIPVEQYTLVRNFFERIRASEQSRVVLVKKQGTKKMTELANPIH
jgi:hypothetical protein